MRIRLRRRRQGATWGLFLVGIGVLLLFVQIGALRLPEIREWWPAILIVIGTAVAAAARKPAQIAEGVGLMLIGVWFFAVTLHWYGLTYFRGWPLLVVIWGFQLVLAAVLDGLWPRKEEHRA